MTVYLNGDYLPLEEARISPMDRGFLFGDGVYEVIPVYSRRPFRQAEHLARMDRSLAAIQLPNPLGEEGWSQVVQHLIGTEAAEDQAVYLQVTRGAAPVRDQAFPQPPVPPTVFAFAAPLVTSSPEVLARGVSAITTPDYRWQRCDLKVLSLVANVLLRQQSVDAGCAETIMLRDGFLSEGSSSNIMVVRNGTLVAPPKSHLILPGVTYDVVLELAAAHGLPHEIRPVSEAELRSADEVWITSSTKEVLPVTRLDDQPVGAGVPGPVGQQMIAWYQDFKRQIMRHADR